jgi:LuxR family transcriptional regulator, maltose regulon positive regulatory protein
MRSGAVGENPNPLLELATNPPALRTGLVPRPELAQGLADAREAPLALIVAPAGYGKSTLLAEWAGRDERHFVWVALGQADPRAISSAPALRQRGKWDALTQLVAATRVRHASFVIVLDDAHLIAPGGLGHVVQAALKALPEGSTIAVASRTEPSLPIGRLRAHRLVSEIRTQQLAMAPAEAAALLRQAGIEPEFEDVQALLARTEGWPAALYLAALAALEDPEGLSGFGGHHHLVSEYLRDETLTYLPAHLVSFSVRTAVLDELSGPACDAVLDGHGFARVLEHLARRSPLLIPIDAAHHRYRWHTLMRDMLRAELQRLEPELEPSLRLRASAWYASQGDTQAAIGQTAAAGDPEHTGRLLWRNILPYLTHGRNHLVRGWLGQFSSERIANHPPLAVSASLSALVAGDVDDAKHWSLKAVAVLERGTPDDGSPLGPLATALAVIDAVSAHDGMRRMEDLAADAAESEPEGSPWRPICLLLRAVAMHLQGNRAAAERVLDEGVRLSGNAAPSVTAMCLAQRAMIALEREDWELAAELTDRAVSVVEEWQLASEPLSAVVFAAAAASRAHGGQIDEAKRDLRRGIDLLATLGHFAPWYEAEARILLAHASLWLADVIGARTLLAEASRFARRIPGTAVFSEWFDSAWAHMDTLAETRLAGPSSLTIAELRILRFLPSHRSFREIAAQLGVSANTVKTQAHAVYRKLGAASRSEAIAHAMEAGLLGQ